MKHLLFIVALLSLFLFPTQVFAHHTGLLGPLRHLGIQQIMIVTGAAFLDSLNPTALGVMLLIVHGGLFKKSKLAIRTGILYGLGLITSYITIGIILYVLYTHIDPSTTAVVIQLFFALLLFFSGIRELFIAFFAKKPQALPSFLQKSIVKFSAFLSAGWAFPMGMLIAVGELFVTGAMYLSFIQAITFDKSASIEVILTFMFVYILVFTIPLLIVLFSREVLTHLIGTEQLANRTKLTRGGIGILFILAAVWIILNIYMTLNGRG